jgi:hypothetical protein
MRRVVEAAGVAVERIAVERRGTAPDVGDIETRARSDLER